MQVAIEDFYEEFMASMDRLGTEDSSVSTAEACLYCEAGSVKEETLSLSEAGCHGGEQ